MNETFWQGRESNTEKEEGAQRSRVAETGSRGPSVTSPCAVVEPAFVKLGTPSDLTIIPARPPYFPSCSYPCSFSPPVLLFTLCRENRDDGKGERKKENLGQQQRGVTNLASSVGPIISRRRRERICKHEEGEKREGPGMLLCTITFTTNNHQFMIEYLLT